MPWDLRQVLTNAINRRGDSIDQVIDQLDRKGVLLRFYDALLQLVLIGDVTQHHHVMLEMRCAARDR